MFSIGDTVKILPPYGDNKSIFTVALVILADEENDIPTQYLLDDFPIVLPGRYLEEVE